MATKHIVNSRYLGVGDQIKIATFLTTITSIVKTDEGVLVTGEYSDEIGSLTAEVTYGNDRLVPIYIPD